MTFVPPTIIDRRRWALFVRNEDLTLGGQLSQYNRLDAVSRWNDVGTWVLEIDRAAPEADKLLLPKAGLVVTLDEQVVFSGTRDEVVFERNGDVSTIAVTGFDDNKVLDIRLAMPQPATATPPYSVQAYDVRTTFASLVLQQFVDANAGTGAISTRVVPGLTLGTSPISGSASLTGRGRYQTLLAFLQELALASDPQLSFWVRQNGAALEFFVDVPPDSAAAVVFAVELGNLAGYRYADKAPEANYMIVGGGGDLTARTIREGGDTTSIAKWGRRERFIDRRDTTVTAELDQAIAEELANAAGVTKLELTPVDTASFSWPDDYDLGHTVTAVIEGVQLTEVVRELEIVLDADVATITPRIGSAGARLDPDESALFEEIHRLQKRVKDLERTK